MSKLNKYKIKKLIKFSNPSDFLLDDKNILISKQSSETLEINTLLKKNVYPIGFDFKNKKVLFVETKMVIPHNRVPFMYVPLQKKSEYLIPVPYKDLIKVFSNFKLNDSNFLFIHHPGRCGSTLLHKVLGSNPAVESFSEDLILENLFWRMYTNEICFDEIKSIYKSMLALLIIKWCDSGGKIISFKMGSYSHHYIHSIFRMLPNARHIYITRDPVEIAVSVKNKFRKMYGPDLTFRKEKLQSYFDLDYVHGDMMEKGDYGQYLNKNISPDIISTIGPMDRIESFILRVLLIDNFFNFTKLENMRCLTYTEVLNWKLLFNKLSEFLSIKNDFNEKVYNNHSQSGKKFIGPQTGYFNLTSDQKRKYTLFAERVKRIINLNE